MGRTGVFGLSVGPSDGPCKISTGPEWALCEQASYCGAEGVI